MRPSVASPTGTLMGAPVSTTSRPRESPSVVSIATARTRSSPRCCWTSHTSRLPPAPALMPSASSSAAAAGRTTVIAWLIAGSRSEEAGGRLDEPPVDRDLHIVGHQPAQDRIRVGLVRDGGARAWLIRIPSLLLLARDRGLRERQQALVRDGLAQRRDVRVVDHL